MKVDGMDVIFFMRVDHKGGLLMNAEKAGQLKGTSKPKKTKVCVHQRVVDYHFNEKGQVTGLVCRECGRVIPNPAKVLV
jgi:hypothetical protein